MPETVKYGISNLTLIGAFLSGVASSSVILGRRNSALNIYSWKNQGGKPDPINHDQNEVPKDGCYSRIQCLFQINSYFASREGSNFPD